MKIVILAGGSGLRLWPMSRKEFPKQFIHFGDRHSLLQKTIIRFLHHYSPTDIFVITNQEYYFLVKTQVNELNPQLEQQIIVEPEQKNTAPAIALAISYLTKVREVPLNECVLVCSSDHIFEPEEVLLAAVKGAEPIAQKGKHVIFGICPHAPETGYGYIKAKWSEAQGASPVEAFVEKPSENLAKEYVASGLYLWNAGVFLFQIHTLLSELNTYAPQIRLEGSFQEIFSQFSTMPNTSIDYALLEKSCNVMVMPLKLNWSDIGSWDSVYHMMPKDTHHNVKIGNICEVETDHCLLMGGKRLITTIGLSDLLIVETEDALLIAKKGASQHVKTLVETLKQRRAKESDTHLITHRPWGRFTILEEGERYKIKRIVVEPQAALSLQKHYHRSEHWVVIKGTAKVTLGDQETYVHENESIYVEKGEVHRLENPGKVPLELIEVQVGEYVGEDDIVRFEDSYGRDLISSVTTNQKK